MPEKKRQRIERSESEMDTEGGEEARAADCQSICKERKVTNIYLILGRRDYGGLCQGS